MFQFQYEYTLEDMNALSRVAAKTYRRKRVLIFRAVLAVMAVAYLGMGILLFPSGNLVPGIIFTAAGILFAAIFLFYHQGTAWRAKRMMMEGDSSSTVTLEEERIHGESEKGEGSYPYSAVIGAYHYKERYFLFVGKRHAMLLPERGLIQGDGAHLRAFLEEKLGKEIVELR